MTCSSTSCKEQDGFSLIELLAALTILCIGLLALFSCCGTSIISNTHTAQREDALRMAQEQMEAVKGGDFAKVLSQTEQLQRNGTVYTCDIVVGQREDLKDVNITVSWASRRTFGGAKEQVQLATVILRR